MPPSNERVELEMEIMRYKLLSQRTTDAEFLKRIAEKVAQLEKNLREIDE
jgi:ribosomal protein L18E